MKPQGPVFLIGLMGSGKTTVGKALAQKLGWRWIDLDQAIEKRRGRTVAQIFKQQGAETFRRLESAELRRQDRPSLVVSCGGGVVLDPQNRMRLKASLTLYLAASPEVLVKRLGQDQVRQRPLLKVAGPLISLRRLQRERARFYRASARFEIGRASCRERVCVPV